MSDIEAIAREPGSVTVGGVPEGHDALVATQAARTRGGITLFVARDESRAAAFLAACEFFAPDLDRLNLPAWDVQPYDRVSPSPRIAARRAGALSRLAQRKADDRTPLIVVTTINAVTQRAAPRDLMAKAGFAARPGAMIDQEALKTYFAVNGYSRVATVMEPGDFAIRGGVIDAFAPGMAKPVRLDFFGDTLESLRAFDPESQRTLRQLKSVNFDPVSEVLIDPESISRFRSGFLSAFGAATDSDTVYHAVSEGVRASGAEHFLPLFHERLETVLDYAGEGALIILDALAGDALDERGETITDYFDARQQANESGGKGTLSPAVFRALKPTALYVLPKGFNEALAGRTVRRFSAFADPALDAINLDGKQGRVFVAERASESTNVFDAATAHVDALRKAGRRVLLASWSEGASDRLGTVLGDHGLAPIFPIDDWSQAGEGPKDAVLRAVFPLERGFETGDLAILSEQDILGDRLARPRGRKRSADVILQAGSLSAGDLVVHADHGLARYLGLKTLTVQDAPHDCLELEYHGGAKLFLPVENIELLSRYGADSEDIQLDRLGGAAWQARKAKAKKRLRDMAADLIRIAAERHARTTDTIDPPSGIYDEFCAGFPFAETEDQLNAISDVFEDFAKGRPMDRLICGDVGFGKTEVALRAAFVAAMSGKQVAVVAPTTLLARQHYATFTERFRNWPVKIRRLSRLVPGKEATATKAELAEGKAEIVIGTHAVLSKTVKFADLGLLIVDEEQHFGVKHKERLKDLRADVHVLTLTATPIPRTLQLALTGIRDLSIIATPPVDRLAVRTYVAPFDAVTIREALLREKYRGGQAYFVTARIADLDSLAEFLREQVPEVSFITAHGQMAPGRLEDIMTAFYEGRYDVLLSTTIVESGLDIPTANTLVIHRADRFGLAQLYQLRGRVGRSKTRAYAYLMTPQHHRMTASAETRLQVLHSLDSLGAGFTLASHDLDLRGGGNLLGEEQSGHIRDVGVELYQSMLEEAVASLKGDDGADDRDWSPSINAGVSVLIPEDYVPDLDVRLSLYRRLSQLETRDEREALAAEFIDRFGPLPEEVEHLLRVMAIKHLCKVAGVAKLDAGPKGAVVHFRNNEFADPAGLIGLMGSNPEAFKVRPDQKLVLIGNWPEGQDRLRGLERGMSRIADLATRAKKAA
ncbi:transcription-repair coupling factor [Hyphobacterium marinum]|uniref:Transcription-repair-coupling factor n=1 Tax=Hyphobacterium marinum TaxID=3116574 RepID=A0ABU7LYL2_9PROT|nr:transcription-repair coupling factor [Hyphobacterium sp. Y6023]MEE2566628.1 transcription-repair coupling factor [Hyphobacterium sp. Y6023]